MPQIENHDDTTPNSCGCYLKTLEKNDAAGTLYAHAACAKLHSVTHSIVRALSLLLGSVLFFPCEITLGGEAYGFRCLWLASLMRCKPWHTNRCIWRGEVFLRFGGLLLSVDSPPRRL